MAGNQYQIDIPGLLTPALAIDADFLDEKICAMLKLLGSLNHLVPRHTCPTVNNFDSALIITGGKVSGVERVTARGHEMLPLALGAETGSAAECVWPSV